MKTGRVDILNKKIMTIGLSIVLILVGVCFLTFDLDKVHANDEGISLTTHKSDDFSYATFTDRNDDVKDCVGSHAPGDVDGYVFAGWYRDVDCTKTVESDDDVIDAITTYYAKYVSEDVLSTKVQVSTTDVNTEDGADTRNMRFVSSVDSVKYDAVGFAVKYEETEDSDVWKKYKNTGSIVYSRIETSDENSPDTYKFSPKVVDTKSKYFITATWKGPDNTSGLTNFDTNYYVRAYWVTLDGVTVYGPTRYVSVNDGLNKDIVNLPMKDNGATATWKKGETVQVTYGENGTANATVGYHDGTYAHMKIDLDSTSENVTDRAKVLDSVTEFAVGTKSELYRNLYTQYTGSGTADDTWYEFYKAENEFVIATSADLYGFASKSSSVNFSEATVYVVSDIVVNEEQLNTDSTDTTNYLKWYNEEKKEYNTTPTYTTWDSIGKSNAFAGVFDGQGHTISGIYQVSSTANNGLFGQTANGSTVQNVELVNSYFECTISSGNTWHGSIAGSGNGNFSSIRSAAVVVCAANSAGGMIGQKNGAGDIVDCCFEGILTISGTNGGGIIGWYRASGTVNMKHCLFQGTINGSSAGLGGLCGYVSGTYLGIDDSLSWGSLSTTSGYQASVVGRVNSTSSTVEVTNTYFSSNNTSAKDTGVKSQNAKEIKNEAKDLGTTSIVAYDGWYNNTAILSLNLENYWCLVDGVTPQLRSFTNPEDILPMLEGQGTEESPWLITKAEDLSNLATIAKSLDFSGKYVSVGTAEQTGELTITINSGDTVAEVKANAVAENGSGNWTPIGGVDMPFAGTFNGNENTISGLYYNGADTYVGLFGYISNTATIKSLKLTNSYLQNTGTGSAYMGSIVGCTQGTVDTVMSDAVLESKAQTGGGIAGGVSFTGTTTETIKFTNCWYDGIITLTTGTGRQSGGIVGYIDAPYKTVIIEHCLNTGELSATRADGYTQLGGICGLVNRYGSFIISDTLNAKVLKNSSESTGSVIGKITPTTAYTMNDVYGVDGLASNETTYEHALIGTGGTVSSESANYSVVDIEDAKGTDVWYNNTLTLDFENYWEPVIDGTPELKSFSTNAVGLWSGQGTQSSPWIITNKAEIELLSALAQTYNFDEKYFQLGTDEQAGELTIAVNEGTVDEIKASSPANWVPIGTSTNPFAGTFDGNGNTISGLYYNGDGTYIGLFAVTGNNAEVKELKITNSYFESSATGYVHVGSVAGVGYGAFTNIKSEAEIACYGQYIGGIVGSVWRYGGATFNNCWFAGRLRVEGAAAEKCGGILGGAFTSDGYTVNINNCLNSGFINISSLGDEKVRVGGICGFVQTVANITNCLNATSFTTYRARVAAIVGDAYYGSVLTLQNVYAITGDGADGTYNSSDYCGHICEAEGDNEAATVTLVDNSWAKLTAEQLAGTNAETHASALFTTENSPWITGDLYPVLNILGEIGMSIPEMTVASADSTTVTTLTGDGNFVKQIMATTRTEYENYLTSLETAGFEKYAYNVDDENCATSSTVLCGTYAKDNLILNATYFVSEGRTSISYYEGALSEHLISGDTTEDAGYETTLSMLEMFHYGNSFVIQLKNGHFIVSDGGMGDELIYLIEYLESLVGKDTEGNQIVPVIEAWFITHAHGDHTGALNSFWNAGKRELVNRVCVEGVYYSSPSDDEVLSISGCQTVDYGIARVTNCLLRNQAGEPTPLYRPQTGQRYYFNNEVTIDIMLAQEQLEMNADKTTEVGAMRANLNSSSTVSLVTIDGQTCLLPGDLQEAGFDILFANYDATLFSTLDFFALNHHGFNTSRTIAEKVTAQTILKTVKDATPVRCETAIQTLCDKATESVAWGNGTVVFTFPYTPDKTIPTYDVLALNSWAWKDTTEPKYHDYSERQEQENIDKGTDGTTDEEFE